MIKHLRLAAGIALTSSTVALADTPKQERFTRDGQTYVYTVREQGARRLVDGRAYPSRESFHLVIRGNRVTGTSGSHEVAFDAAATR